MSHPNCKLCGSNAISTDEVETPGAAQADSLLLAECLRCEARWTQPVFRGALAAPRLRLGRVRRDISAEVVSAA